LLYGWLPHPDMAVARVAARVAAGGHDVPERDIRRRYDRSTRNFLEVYMHLANTWEVYDSSSDNVRLIASGDGDELAVMDRNNWKKFTQ